MSDVAFQQAGEFAAIRTQQTSSETNIITQLASSETNMVAVMPITEQARETITSSPSITSTGTVLNQGAIGSEGGGPVTGVGGDAGGEEWLITGGTKYLMQFTAGAATSTATMRVRYDEER